MTESLDGHPEDWSRESLMYPNFGPGFETPAPLGFFNGRKRTKKFEMPTEYYKKRVKGAIM